MDVQKLLRNPRFRLEQGGPAQPEAVKQFEDRAFQELPAIEKIALELCEADSAAAGAGGDGNGAKPSRCREFLTKYTNDFARATIDKWSELAGTFWESLARPY